MMNFTNFKRIEGEIFKKKAEIVKLMGKKKKITFNLIIFSYISKSQQNKIVAKKYIIIVNNDDTMEIEF